MTRLETLSLHETELLSGGCCADPTTNPSQAYGGMNYGQAKKAEDFTSPNPSAIYCPDLNYGQAKKAA